MCLCLRPALYNNYLQVAPEKFVVLPNGPLGTQIATGRTPTGMPEIGGLWRISTFLGSARPVPSAGRRTTKESLHCLGFHRRRTA